MKIFISWSKDLSHEVAKGFSEYLPYFDEHIVPFLSSENIEGGTRWNNKINEELASTSFAIICITPDNYNSNWIHFEAGAISSRIGEKSKVCPIYFGMDVSDLPSTNPLKQFQGFSFNHDGIKKLLVSINKDLEKPMQEARLLKMIDWSWQEFYEKLKPFEDEARRLQHLNDDNLTPEIKEKKKIENYYFRQMHPTLMGIKSSSDRKEYTSQEEKISRIQETVIDIVKETSMQVFGTERPPLISELSDKFSGTPLPCKVCDDNIEVVDGGCKFCGLDCHIWIKKPTLTERGMRYDKNNGNKKV